MRLHSLLFACALFIQICGVFMVNLPNPGTPQAEDLLQRGMTLLKPAEPALEMLDQNHSFTEEMSEPERLLLYTIVSIPLNMVLAWAVLRIMGNVFRKASSRFASSPSTFPRSGL
jgi:hypothetical protein